MEYYSESGRMRTCCVRYPSNMGIELAPAAKKGIARKTAGPREMEPSAATDPACSSRQAWIALSTPTNGLRQQVIHTRVHSHT